MKKKNIITTEAKMKIKGVSRAGGKDPTQHLRHSTNRDNSQTSKDILTLLRHAGTFAIEK